MTSAERHALELLKVAARTYARESSGGAHPMLAGARLRLAAKAFAQAETDGGSRLVPNEGKGP